MRKTYFISGIDTDAGKTYATAFLANKWIAEGFLVITQKFIQTGCQGISEDIIKHRELMKTGLLDVDKNKITCPVVLSYPASPHLAARIDHVEIDLSVIRKSTEYLEQRYDRVLLEGAGGLMVPVTEDYLSIDYIVEEKLPLIFVTSAKLGSINHTLLALDTCKRRGVELAMLIYNQYPKEKTLIEDDTRLFLKQYLSVNFPDTEWFELPCI